MEEMKKKRLKEIISNIGGIKGRHTELVSVYVPAGFNLVKIVDMLRTEQSTAQNIKSKAVRKNVLGALEKILQHLKLYKQTPVKGMVIFCGNVSEKEGAADIELWSIEPPEPVKNKLYWCGQNFIIDPLKEMVKEREIYGLVVLDKSEADIGVLKGKKVEVLKHMESLVPGKTKAGGWSQARYARVREGLLNDFLKNVGEIASQKFKEYKDLKGVIIGGPGPIKEQFMEGKFLNYDIKKRILGIVNTAYTREYGLNEMINLSDDLISQASIIKEKKILDRFFDELGKDSGLAEYGLENVTKALKAGNVDLILISEAFDWVKASLDCKCGHKEEKILREGDLSKEKCPKCENRPDVVAKKELVDDIISMAEGMGTKVETISVSTTKGEQLKELGGIGGILRYKSS
jgi:peptide chain release factor subunit 1